MSAAIVSTPQGFVVYADGLDWSSRLVTLPFGEADEAWRLAASVNEIVAAVVIPEEEKPDAD